MDPLDVTVNRNVARALDATGQDEAALAQWNRTLELDPNHLRSQVPFALFLLEHGPSPGRVITREIRYGGCPHGAL